jgi:hypothetical protein
MKSGAKSRNSWFAPDDTAKVQRDKPAIAHRAADHGQGGSRQHTRAAGDARTRLHVRGEDEFMTKAAAAAPKAGATAREGVRIYCCNRRSKRKLRPQLLGKCQHDASESGCTFGFPAIDCR